MPELAALIRAVERRFVVEHSQQFLTLVGAEAHALSDISYYSERSR